MIIKVEKGNTIFKPAFGNKKDTIFYQYVDGDKILGEIEIDPISKDNNPEILSLYSNIKHIGTGTKLVKEIISIYNTKIWVRTTKSSKPFWEKMGAKHVENDMFCIN